GGTPHPNLPTALLPHQPNVFDGCFGAVSWTAHRSHLHLMRSEQVLEAPLHLDAGADRILHAEAAEVGAHAGLHHAHALGIGLTRWHSQIGPYFWQVRFIDTQQIDALASRDFHHTHVVFVGDISDAAQFFRRGHSATNTGNDREGTVSLDVGMHAVVDKARRAVFIMVSAPEHVEHVAQGRLADLA